MKAADRHWLRGYAAALAAAARGWNEHGMVEMIMKGDGISLSDMEAAGVEPYDLNEIRASHRHEAVDAVPDQRPARCAECGWEGGVTKTSPCPGCGSKVNPFLFVSRPSE